MNGVGCTCGISGSPTGASRCYDQSVGVTDYGTCFACIYDHVVHVISAVPSGDCVGKLSEEEAYLLCKQSCADSTQPPQMNSIINVKCSAIDGYFTSANKDELLREALEACNARSEDNARRCRAEGEKSKVGGAFKFLSCVDPECPEGKKPGWMIDPEYPENGKSPYKWGCIPDDSEPRKIPDTDKLVIPEAFK